MDKTRSRWERRQHICWDTTGQMSYQRQGSMHQRRAAGPLQALYDLYQAIKLVGKLVLGIALLITTIITAIQLILQPFQQTYKAFRGFCNLLDGVLWPYRVRRRLRNASPGVQQPAVQPHGPSPDCRQG